MNDKEKVDRLMTPRVRVEHPYPGMQGVTVKYLHQLQNLYFALSGEELIVNF